MDIPPQASFLYKGLWSPSCDMVFVDCLLALKAENRSTQAVFPSTFLLTAAEELKNVLGVAFSEGELKDRAEVLEMRYHTFRRVVRQWGATWDMPSKSVIAPDEVWEKIFHINKFAAAYYHHEEPIYSRLACLFGMEDVKVEDATQVIVISDTTEELPFNDNDDEVNSPMGFPRPIVKCKLFEDALETNDRESTTEPRIHFIDLTADGQLRTRVERGKDLPKPPRGGASLGGPSTRSPHGSSCASNSPIGWWPKLQK